MKLKLFVTIIASMVFSAIYPQTQNGNVRTAGTPSSKGKPISNVSIKMKGNYNSTVSDQNGHFQVRMEGLKNGDPIFVERVFKMGYILTDSDFLSKAKAFSTRTPLEIVMKSKDDIARERAEIENAAYAKANATYEEKVRQLDSALAASAITIEEKEKQLAKLQEGYQTFEALLSSISEYYAMTDYDALSKTDVQIHNCIREGNLLKADSLINSKGNLNKRISDFKEEDSLVRKAEEELEKATRKFQDKKNNLLKSKEILANDLYNKYTVCLGRFYLDSAEYYILARASLDSTNIGWQLSACSFLEDYSGKYQQAYNMYLQSLKSATQSGNNTYVADTYNSLGSMLATIGDPKGAMTLFKKAMVTNQMDTNSSPRIKAAILNNIAGAFGHMMQADSMLAYATKALEINKQLFGEYSKECAHNYNTIANAYSLKKDNNSAINYYRKNIDILKTNYGENSIFAALNYNNLATAYMEQGNINDAVNLLKEAWTIIEKTTMTGSIHRATVASNLSLYLNRTNNITESLGWIEKAITSLESGRSDMNLLGLCYIHKADILKVKGNLNEALSNYDKALTCTNSLDTGLKIAIKKSEIHEFHGNYSEVINCFKAILDKCDKDTTISQNTRDAFHRDLDGYMNISYLKMINNLSNSPEQAKKAIGEYKEFLKDKIYYFIVASPNGPAAQLGLSGVNYLLQMNDWEADCLKDFQQMAAQYSGKSKNIVLFTPNGIKKLQFSNKLGAQVYMGRIPHEFKSIILNEYLNWKANVK